MVRDSQSLTALGRRIGRALGEGPPETRRPAQRAAVLERLRRGPARGRPRIAAVLGLAAALVVLLGAAALGGWWWRARQAPEVSAPELAFRIEGREGPDRVGRWLEARDGALALRFDGGTRFELERGARVKVAEARPEQVSLRLDHGALHADVRASQTTWHVEAGPYRVTVIGTAFVTRWDASRGALQVRVRRGRVRVTGDGLTPGGVELGASDALRVDRAAQRWTVLRSGVATTERGATPRPGAERGATPAGAEAAVRAPRPGAAVEASPPAEGPPPRGASAPGWRRHLAAGRFLEAAQAAESAGIATLARTLPVADLWALARAGRVGRRGAVARQCLEALRRRFPGSANARTAAFLLGRVAVELEGDAAAAARWFERYLAESPGGPLAEEALGRAVDARARAGDGAEAARLARRYLQTYPAGTFARLARRHVPR